METINTRKRFCDEECMKYLPDITHILNKNTLTQEEKLVLAKKYADFTECRMKCYNAYVASMTSARAGPYMPPPIVELMYPDFLRANIRKIINARISKNRTMKQIPSAVERKEASKVWEQRMGQSVLPQHGPGGEFLNMIGSPLKQPHFPVNRSRMRIERNKNNISKINTSLFSGGLRRCTRKNRRLKF